MDKIRNHRIVLIEYVFLVLCLAAVFFFMIPQVDVFWFSRACDSSISEIIAYSLNYGNGRLLGNIIGVYFSHHFAFAWILVVVTLALIVVLLNGIFFSHSKYTVFPLAILVTFPSAGILEECYVCFAAFANFCLPILLIIVDIYIYMV